jgi:hypothetical protein
MFLNEKYYPIIPPSLNMGKYMETSIMATRAPIKIIKNATV